MLVKTTVNNIRAYEDSDKVFLQTVYIFAGAGEQVAFDIFRFDSEGRIAEHWDVMELQTRKAGRMQMENFNRCRMQYGHVKK